MPKTGRKRDDCLEVRLGREQKELIEEAASLVGQPVSSFAVSTLLDHARAVITEHHTLALSKRDWLRFAALLDDPPAPNAKLRAAMRVHLKRDALRR